jgi:predicted HicB family RNase H-like nuclease
MLLQHKGYVGSAEIDELDGYWKGKLMFTHQVVTFESPTNRELDKAFQKAVNKYINSLH